MVLGYFSLVAMSRVHVMCGDYYAALKAVRCQTCGGREGVEGGREEGRGGRGSVKCGDF